MYKCRVYTNKDVLLRVVGKGWELIAVLFLISPSLQGCPCSACHYSDSRAGDCWAICFLHGSCSRFLPVSFLFTVTWLRADGVCPFPSGVWKDALTVKLDYT